MTREQLQSLLDDLIASWENEVIEFKEANDTYETDKIGRYFSALSNEANLRGVEKSWLVFGVSNKTRQITTTDYRSDPDRLQSTKQQISADTEPNSTFRNIYELKTNSGQRIVLFEIPAAPRGIAIAWKGHYYGRAGESLSALSVDKQDEIRRQSFGNDWSAQLVPDATFDDLDPVALKIAKDLFVRKHANRIASQDIQDWSFENLLNKMRLTQHNQLTRAALLLLGKAESIHLLSPQPAEITWKLEGPERAYEHFHPPFLLATTQIYKRIRNVQLRILPQDELLPIEVAKYDQRIVLEALHNCIAHQDYLQNARILVTEQPEKLIFENAGSFFEGRPDDYIFGNKTPLRYRNALLVEAMVALNMIDKMGYGIHDMHRGQASRYFPLPDYNLSDSNAVRMTIHGGVVDPAYTRILIQKTDLSLPDIFALDRIQKNLPIPDDAMNRLRKGGLIEGRKPNVHVSAIVAAATASKADYIRTRTLDDEFYKKILNEYLNTFGKASRKEIDAFLKDKLSSALNDSQKTSKIGNLLTKMRIDGLIHNYGSYKFPVWMLVKNKE